MLIQMQINGCDGYFNSDSITKIIDQKDGTTSVFLNDGSIIAFNHPIEEIMKTLRRASVDVMNSTLKA